MTSYPLWNTEPSTMITLWIAQLFVRAWTSGCQMSVCRNGRTAGGSGLSGTPLGCLDHNSLHGSEVSQQRISQIEHAEVTGTLTISSLRETADALGCDFVYALVPRKPLDDIVREQAWRKASELVGPVDQTMELEGQRVESDRTET